jgi:hypothetical protein
MSADAVFFVAAIVLAVVATFQRVGDPLDWATFYMATAAYLLLRAIERRKKGL